VTCFIGLVIAFFDLPNRHPNIAPILVSGMAFAIANQVGNAGRRLWRQCWSLPAWVMRGSIPPIIVIEAGQRRPVVRKPVRNCSCSSSSNKINVCSQTLTRMAMAQSEYYSRNDVVCTEIHLALLAESRR